ncbi:MAG TPA: ECF transporter S component [Candidatus Acidoferrum sp.]|nr:ECF transporter S component [Candidatus Acidoferrum sp.]
MSEANVNQRTRKLVAIALLAAVTTILMYFETPLPFFPPFLKLDVSNLAVIVGAFLFGPWAVLPIALIPNLFHFFSSTSGGAGQLANFLLSCAYGMPAGIVYRVMHTKKGALIGCMLGTLCATVAGALTNIYILIPFYSTVMLMPLEQIWAACAAVNPVIVDLNTYILYGVIPFNILKYALISIITIVIYKPISRIIHQYGKI